MRPARAPPAGPDAQQVPPAPPAVSGASGRHKVAARATVSRPARTHGRSAVRAPARSAHPARVPVSAGSALRRRRRGPGRAAAVGASAGREASSRRRPAGRLPFVLEPRPGRAAVNGLGTRRRPISTPPRPRPARAPPRPRVPSPRAPRPGARPALTRPGWAGAHVPRGAPRSHWSACRARPRSQPMRVERLGGGAPRGGAGRGAGSKRIAVRKRGMARTGAVGPYWGYQPTVFARRLTPRWETRGSLVLSARLDRPRDARPTASGAEAGRMGRPCAGLGFPWPDHSQTRSPEYGVLRARPPRPSSPNSPSRSESLCICIWLSSAPEPPNRTRQEAPFSGWPSRPPRQTVPSLRPHSVPPHDSHVIILLVAQLSFIGCFLNYIIF